VKMVDHPCWGGTLAGTALFAPLEWFHELTLGLVAEGLSW